MNIKLGVFGLNGRMGMEVASLFNPFYSINGLSFELDKSGSCDVWIDFSSPEGTMTLLREAKAPVVIGTTGFHENQMEQIIAYAKKYPVLLAPNLSPGMNLMRKLIKQLNEAKNLGFEAVLSETHHKHKKDAPSGTAKSLLSSLSEIGYPDPQVLVTRAGAEKGLHKVTFYSDEEEISLEHRVVDRKVFAKGALLGAAYLLNKKTPGLYVYEEVV